MQKMCEAFDKFQGKIKINIVVFIFILLNMLDTLCASHL